MRRLLLLLAAVSLQAAGQAPAEPPKPAAAPDKPAAAPSTEPRRPLILRLDEVDGPRMSFGRSASETDAGKELPSLGGDARKINPNWAPPGSRGSPYPHTSENLE